jgi:hypothetical protein
MSNCQAEEDLIKEQETATTLIYKEQITAFLGTLKLGGDKSQNRKINALLEALDNASIATIDLKSTEKLIIVRTNNLKDLETNDAVRLIFVQYQNKIFRSNIVTFKNSSDFNDYDALLQAIFDRKSNKYNYSGNIKFHNPFHAGLLELNYQQGELMWQGAVRNKNKQKSIQKSNGCTDWYWVTTYSDGHVKQDYLYTTCSCEEEAYRTSNYCGGGGSGGSSSGNNASTSTQPIHYPTNPVNNQLFVYINEKGEIIMEKYDSKKQKWEKVGISLSEVVINNNRENYNTEFYMIPNFNAKVKQNFFGIDFIFIYDPASASWEGQSEEAIADTIEDKIIDSELDPCPKGVMDKLKNTTNNDIAAILKKLGANKDFTVNVVSGFAGGLPAQSASNKAFAYNIIISVDYVSSTDLFRASNLLHELVHVYFMSIVDEYKSNPKNSQYTYNLTNFPSLFQAYCDKKFPPTNTTSANAHHLEMANQYVETIASALQEFNKINDPNGNIPYQVYSDLAWGGLMNTPVYNEKYVTGGTEDTRIKNRYSCESNGNEVASGTPNAQKPAGKPCK